jgi:hypothetical protein
MSRIASIALALALVGCDEPETEHAPLEEVEPQYDMRANPAQSYRAGEQGTFEIVLTSRGGQHLQTNRGYPFGVALSGPSQITFPQAALDWDDTAEVSEERIRVPVTFTPSAAGSHQVTANVQFGVCHDAMCFDMNEPLAVTLPVE